MPTVTRLPRTALLALLVLGVASCARPCRMSGIGGEGAHLAPELVLIPGGEFLMGAEGGADYSPVHRVHLDAFYMDRCEVTNAQYFTFCKKTGHRLPEFWGMDEFRCGPRFPNHPVVGISWYDAKACAEWRGMRLPTEAEWEYAARGGLVGKEFAHGDEIDSSLANYHWPGKVDEGTAPVASYRPNGYGLYDMTGNVVEWVWDLYAAVYYDTSPEENPTGPEEGRFRVIRGGGWHSGPGCVPVYFRNTLPGNWVDFNVGFRCAKDADQRRPR